MSRADHEGFGPIDLSQTVAHNDTTVESLATPRLCGPDAAWSNIASVPLPPCPEGHTVHVRVSLVAEAAAVLISLADESGHEILCREHELKAGDEETVELEAPMASCVLLRTAEGAQKKPLVTIHQIVAAMFPGEPAWARVSASHGQSSSIQSRPSFRKTPVVDRLLAITHTSREWQPASCSREVLARRYAGKGRFLDAPPLEDLGPSETLSYSGGLSIVRLRLDGDTSRLDMLGHLESRHKIQAANAVGTSLVLCTEGRLLVLPWEGITDRRNEKSVLAALSAKPRVINDPWFAGLHTVFPITDEMVLVSASGPDAALWVNIRTGRVTRRWRLPSDQYGSNYKVEADTSIHDHYIPNDLQLGHLNSAYPLGNDGAIITTLGQGDVGVVAGDGSFVRAHHGSIGCHGARINQDKRVFFSDSCSGQIRMLIPRSPGDHWAWAQTVWSSTSRWLHDATEVDRNLYVLAHGDENVVSLVDTGRGHEVNRWFFGAYGVNVQFITDLESDYCNGAGASVGEVVSSLGL